MTEVPAQIRELVAEEAAAHENAGAARREALATLKAAEAALVELDDDLSTAPEKLARLRAERTEHLGQARRHFELAEKAEKAARQTLNAAVERELRSPASTALRREIIAGHEQRVAEAFSAAFADFRRELAALRADEDFVGLTFKAERRQIPEAATNGPTPDYLAGPPRNLPQDVAHALDRAEAILCAFPESWARRIGQSVTGADGSDKLADFEWTADDLPAPVVDQAAQAIGDPTIRRWWRNGGGTRWSRRSAPKTGTKTTTKGGR